MWPTADGGRAPQRPDRRPLIAFLVVLAITLIAAALMGGYLLGLRTAQSEQAAFPSTATSAPPATTTTTDAPTTTTTTDATTTDATTTATTTVTTTTTGIGVGTIRNASPAGSPVVLNVGYGVNLDSTQPNWDVVQNNDPAYYNDLRFDTQDTVTAPGRGFAPAQPNAGYADCAAATAYTPLLNINQILAGGAYCTTSAQGRFALVVFHPAVGGQLTFDLTVWEKTP
jgi:cytoskeletal protein RodZ